VKVAKKNLDPSAVSLFEIMTTEVYSLREDDPPAYAIHLISEEGFRHIPIVRGDRPLGFVSLKTIVKYVHDEVLGTK
jgi:CBS domain-containing protein